MSGRPAASPPPPEGGWGKAAVFARRRAIRSTSKTWAHQRLLGTHPEATQNHSLHTTGYAFDILGRYHSRKQAAAFQYELERLQARGLIAWVRDPRTIHATVSSEAKTLVDAMLKPAHPCSAGARP